MYNHIKEIVAAAEKTHKPISELIIEQECQLSGLPREKVWLLIVFVNILLLKFHYH